MFMMSQSSYRNMTSKFNRLGPAKSPRTPQQFAIWNVCEHVGVLKFVLFEFMNVHSDLFLSKKNHFQFQQVGSSKGCARIPNTLELQMFASALA